jgi:hypothetical protein
VAPFVGDHAQGHNGLQEGGGASTAAWHRSTGVEAINQRDADSKQALADAQELYASTEARASTVIKQEEDLAVHARQVNQRARDVEEL